MTVLNCKKSSRASNHREIHLMTAKKKASAKKAEPASQPEGKLPAWAGNACAELMVTQEVFNA